MGKGEIFIYQSEGQNTQIEVRVADETIWLSQKQIAGLFGCSVDNVHAPDESNTLRRFFKPRHNNQIHSNIGMSTVMDFVPAERVYDIRCIQSY